MMHGLGITVLSLLVAAVVMIEEEYMTFDFKIRKPFSFIAAMKTHGWFQLPPFYWNEEAGELVWAVRLNGAVSPVRIKPLRETKAYARLRFDIDDPAAQEIVEQKFSYIMNLDLDLAEFYQLCREDGVLAQVPQRGIGRLMRAESLYEDIFKSICGANVRWKQAVKMIHNIAQLGDVAAGTDFHVFPTAVQVLETGELFLKEKGRVGYRSGYLIDLAQRFANGEADAAAVENGEMNADELKKYFLSFKGIGKTTAHYLLALHGHFEEMSVDSLVIKYMSQRHFNGVAPSEKEVLQFYHHYGRWRYLAYWMEFIINEGWNPDA